MSLRSVVGNDLRELGTCRNDHVAIGADVRGGHALLDGKRGMRAESTRSFTADAHREVRALLDVLGPRTRRVRTEVEEYPLVAVVRV